MNAPSKVASFIASLVVIFGISLAVGNQVGPIAEPVPAHDDADSHNGQP